ncbi:PAS domain S-box protein, partial [bacterium]|nr:PAS domain S-box protein [bacterium]
MDEDRDGNLWLATNYGLFQMIGRKDEYKWYSPKNGFLDRELRSVVCTDDGYIWCSSARSGLSRFHSKTKEVINFNERYGLQNLEFNHDVGLVSRDGTIYFGGDGGVTYLPNGKLQRDPNQHQIVFESVRFKDQNYTMNSSGSHLPLIVDYRSNTLSISYEILNYTQPQYTTYQHRLVGFSDEWSDKSKSRNFQIAHIPAGEYIFEVRATDYLGNESGVASFLFVIQPPLWQKLWFQVLLILMLILWIYGGVKWRISSIQALNKTLETTVQFRTQQLINEKDHIKDIIVSSPVLIITIQPNGDLTLLNPVAESIFGVQSNDVLGEKWWKLALTVNDRNQLQSINAELQNEDAFTIELPITFRTGKTRNIIWKCINHYSEDGRINHSIIFGNDITEHFEKEILETSNREQQNIGREIHDSICQS